MADASDNRAKIHFPIELVLLLFVLVAIGYQMYLFVIDGFALSTAVSYYNRFVIVAKVLSGIITAAAIIGILYVAVLAGRLQPRLQPTKETEEILEKEGDQKPAYTEKWVKMRERLESAGDDDAKIIIIEADALMDDALMHLKIPGDTMADRMKYISNPNFKAANNLWDAHKLRNEIAHGTKKKIVYMDAVYAIEQYESALRELELI
ncbi:MAG: hypothetical protein O2794_03085 [bacterium]|nr:hypothetical protein [bacterium]